MAKTWTKEQQEAVSKERIYWLERFFCGKFWCGAEVRLTDVEVEIEDGHSAIILHFYEVEDEPHRAVYIGENSLEALSMCIGEEILVSLREDYSAVNDTANGILQPWKV